MLNREFNSLLRTMLLNLIDRGWQRTKVYKLLMGEAAQVSRFLTPDENNLPRDFGIKPLQRISELLDHDIHLVLVDRNKKGENEVKNLLETIEEKNIEFVKLLNDKLEERLLENIQSINKTPSVTKMDMLIENMLEDEDL
jgi:Zn-dependent oligopeptidase